VDAVAIDRLERVAMAGGDDDALAGPVGATGPIHHDLDAAAEDLEAFIAIVAMTGRAAQHGPASHSITSTSPPPGPRSRMIRRTRRSTDGGVTGALMVELLGRRVFAAPGLPPEGWGPIDDRHSARPPADGRAGGVPRRSISS
jgi:hypothetical protein